MKHSLRVTLLVVLVAAIQFGLKAEDPTTRL
jgi:hypothetical protein